MKPSTHHTMAVAGLFAGAALLAGCNPQHPTTPQTDQSRICTFGDLTEAKRCHSGELAFFSPEIYGNESLPITVIAAYCDTNAPVYFNKAGVVCTFTDKRGLKALLAPAASAPGSSKP